MLPLALADIARIVHGELHDVPNPSARVSAPLVFDSRQAETGSLFLALTGEHTDGHAHAQGAVERGAVAALTTRPVGVPAIVVPHVLDAAGLIAQHVIADLTATVIAVTGSAGKTSTKDLIAHLLTAAGPTVATAQSYNNEIGLPVTASRADADTRFLVLEMGARHIGDIASLARLAPPQVSVVLNVGSAHVGEFGGKEQIARAKGELVEALPASGLAVLNADDVLVRAMADRTTARVITFGLHPDATIRAENVHIDADGRPRFDLVTPEGRARVAMRMLGEHQVSNALAAAAVAREAGLPVDRIAELLGEATVQSRWRMEVTTRPDEVTVVNDSYNANPDAMRVSLRAVASMGGGKDRRTIAVLGEMRELGDESRTAHEQVGTAAGTLGYDHVISIGGTEAQWMAEAARAAGAGTAHHVPDQDAAQLLLDGLLRPGDIVLFKASRGVGLEALVQKVLESDTAATTQGVLAAD
ncbi:UDP-N-acetylmuramoyl-tripeptide--D-alanyl-D-alanine ligase [Streptomyces sp. NPDC091292]|uniref:UDP-N-acetylmuramoyl-tripeptide--D-alanyl-D- alanine ligase n=1 Tax=Streptomyces sp. NPDC091292 TaxID=3365991 RepID=UPI0038285831